MTRSGLKPRPPVPLVYALTTALTRLLLVVVIVFGGSSCSGSCSGSYSCSRSSVGGSGSSKGRRRRSSSSNDASNSNINIVTCKRTICSWEKNQPIERFLSVGGGGGEPLSHPLRAGVFLVPWDTEFGSIKMWPGRDSNRCAQEKRLDEKADFDAAREPSTLSTRSRRTAARRGCGGGGVCIMGHRWQRIRTTTQIMRLRWKIHTTSTSNQHHQQPVYMSLRWKIHTTSTPSQHHQQPIDLRLCWKIHTTSTSNQHHQQPIDIRLCWNFFYDMNYLGISFYSF